ncbi:MAG: radical SAM protein [Candidatus Hadarchaeales archaeon]
MAEIVLTADRTLMSNYGGSEFLGFAACAPKIVPDWFYKLIFSPSIPHKDGVASAAPAGTRKVEAALLERGFDVVVAHPEHLDKVIDEKTKAVGITTNDPLGLGPASTTFSELAGRETYSALYFRKLITNPLFRKNKLKVIVGGPGAWQLTDERIIAKFDIDCVVVGEGEITAVKIFEKALRDEELPRIVQGEVVPLENIPSIRNPTINGFVEIARGCGRGCKFCNPTLLNFRCRPIEKILEEVSVNVDAGLDVLLHAEDILRYGANGVIPNEEKVLKLFEEVLKFKKDISISHFAFASVMAKPNLIRDLSELLNVGSKQKPWISGQVGIETGSPRIIERYMRGKVLPFKPEQWPEVVLEAHKLLDENHWVPCSTLVIGFPDEKPDDIVETIELVEKLREYRSLIVPLFFVPIGVMREEKFFRLKDMLPEHWMLFAACLRHDFKWVENLARDHFRKNPVQGFVIRNFVLKLLKRKLEPYLRAMEQGESPI